MLIFGKVILIIFILCTMGIDANRARRRRQAPPPPGAGPNPQFLNAPGQPPMGQRDSNDIGLAKQSNRQYYPYQGQMGGYGSIQGLNYPYGGAGLGSYQYGSGQYGQYGGYGQYPGSSYSGYGNSYNRPGYGSSNYYPSGGSNYGGYFWNAGEKNHINKYTVILSSFVSLIIYYITI